MGEYEKRTESESHGITRITNKDLICKDCLFRFDDTEKFANTSQCKRYSLKPNNVLIGKNCPRYTKE